METNQTGTFQDVSNYKLEQAMDDLDTAKLLLKSIKIRWRILIKIIFIQEFFKKI